MYTCTVMSSTDTGTPSSTDIPNSSETSHSNPPPHTPPPHNVHTSKPTSLRVPNTTCDVKDIPKPTSKVDNTTIDDSRPTDSDEVELIPLPPPHPRGGVSILAHKLWIGNLDKRLTDQNILRFVTQYGSVVSFRFLFKAGSERAEPRGYVFVEYSSREEAEIAKAGLDGKKALGKKIIVDWAKADLGLNKKTASTVSETWDASAVSKTLGSRESTTSKIAALEAKLRQMEESDVPVKRPRLSPHPLTHRHTLGDSRSVY